MNDIKDAVLPADIQRPSAPADWRLILFGVVQAAVLGGLGWLASQGLARQEAQKKPPEFREEPLEVRPKFNVPAMVSDDQLKMVVTKLVPKLGTQPKINHVDHALRMWGAKARFADPEALSGNDLREILLDHRRFQKSWGEKTPEFLIAGRGGVLPRLREGNASASHTDHTLACLGESLTPLNFPVITTRGETEVRSILERSLVDFSLNQTEYEWSALAYGLYIKQPAWFNREGQQVSFDRLAGRILRQELPEGVCLGNHRLHALVMLLRIDEQNRILSAARRAEIVAFLKDVVQRLVKSQNDEGWWDRDWAGMKPPENPEIEIPPSTLSQRILATGHALEWMALAPAELHAPEAVRVKAAQWLVKVIEPMTPRQIQANYTFLTHAGRALALWRGKFPAEVLP